jgi:hypothetical protein
MAFYKCKLLSLIAIPQDAVTIFIWGDETSRRCDSLEQRQVNGHNYHRHTPTWLRQRFDNLPLHHAIYFSANTMTTTLLSNIIL